MGLREIETVNWITVRHDGICRNAFVHMAMNFQFFKFVNFLHTSTYQHVKDNSEPFTCTSLILIYGEDKWEPE
jgi:hypothetical protein